MLKALPAMLLLGLVAAMPAQGAFPGENGKIAFSTFRDGDNEIYTIEPDATGLTRITQTPGHDLEPAWSPNGRKIAFQSSRAATDPTCQSTPFPCDFDIYVMNADGSDVVRLTDHPGGDFEPAWSPDGSKIVWTTTRDHEGPVLSDAYNSELYVMNADGTAATRITSFPLVDKEPAWSPDGSRIAFFRGDCAFNCRAHIHTAMPDGGDVTPLTSGPVRDRKPNWSPDGARIVFSREGFTVSFWHVSRDGGTPISIPGPRQEPAWSPDGTRIAFGHPGVGTMDVDAGNPRLLFADGSSPDWQPLVAPRREDYKNGPEFCRAEREYLGDARFSARYGGGANAFGKCVSAKR